jgi:hypothetical protein
MDKERSKAAKKAAQTRKEHGTQGGGNNDLQAEVARVGRGNANRKRVDHNPRGKAVTAAKSGELLVPGEVRKELMAAIATGTDQEGSVAQRRANALADWCNKYQGADDLIREVLDPKKAGYKSGTTDYVRLMEARQFVRFWFHPGTTMDERNKIASDDAGNWRDRVTFINERMRAHQEQVRIAGFQAEAMKAFANKPPAEAQKLIENFVEGRVAAMKQEQAAKQAKPLNPQAFAHDIVIRQYRTLREAHVAQQLQDDPADALMAFARAVMDEAKALIDKQQAEAKANAAAAKAVAANIAKSGGRKKGSRQAAQAVH